MYVCMDVCKNGYFHVNDMRWIMMMMILMRKRLERGRDISYAWPASIEAGI